jgi:hypothetical protein
MTAQALLPLQGLAALLPGTRAEPEGDLWERLGRLTIGWVDQVRCEEGTGSASFSGVPDGGGVGAPLHQVRKLQPVALAGGGGQFVGGEALRQLAR